MKEFVRNNIFREQIDDVILLTGNKGINKNYWGAREL